MAERVFEASPFYFYSHMPFLMMWKGMKVLLFAYSTEINEDSIDRGRQVARHRRWKLAFYNYPYNELQFFNVPGEDIEDVVCSPEAYVDPNSGQYILTYSLGKRRYGMMPSYNLHAASIDHMMAYYYSGMTYLTEPRAITLNNKPIFNGFDHQTYLVFHGDNSENGTIHVWTHDRLRHWTLHTTGLQHILRTTYTWENHHRWMFTGMDHDGQFRTFLYDWDNRHLEGELLVEGKPVYKCTMMGDEVIYSDRVENGNFEERHLMSSKDWEIVPPTIPFTVTIE